jgi:hypothetical protein
MPPRAGQGRGFSRPVAIPGQVLRRAVFFSATRAMIRRDRGGGFMEHTITVILLLIALIIYMLPTLIAYARDIPQRKAVTVFNIVLGWTLIGWFIAFLWATLAATTPEELA